MHGQLHTHDYQVHVFVQGDVFRTMVGLFKGKVVSFCSGQSRVARGCSERCELVDLVEGFGGQGIDMCHVGPCRWGGGEADEADSSGFGGHLGVQMI